MKSVRRKICGQRQRGGLTGVDVGVLLHVALLMEALSAVRARIRSRITVD